MGRFHKIVVTPGLAASQVGFCGGHTGEHSNAGRAAFLAKDTAGLKATHYRHFHIQEDQIKGAFLGTRQRLTTIGCLGNVQVIGAGSQFVQLGGDQASYGGAVVHHQDVESIHDPSLCSCYLHSVPRIPVETAKAALAASPIEQAQLFLYIQNMEMKVWVDERCRFVDVRPEPY
jgi:hypothetical protein